MRSARRSLVALAMLVLIGAGCASGPADTGTGTGAGSDNASNHDQAVAFAECMRRNGITGFPDPDASGELTIDAIANGSGLDPSTPAFTQALRACKDLQPAGFTGDPVSPEQQDARLAFARCIRDNGVPDFPDPTPDTPLVDTNRIPSAATDRGMTALNAAMATCGDLGAIAIGGTVTRPSWSVVGAIVVIAAAATGSLVAVSGAEPAAPAAQEQAATTAAVELGTLSATVSLPGTLSYRARSDGSPYAVISQARGTYTELPDVGADIGCGDELHRVDDHPVLLLCGTIPAYRDLHVGDVGNDVRQLNSNLHDLGYDAAVGVDIDPGDVAFTEMTAQALAKLQLDRGAGPTGELPVGGATFLPEPVRIAAVTAELGGTAQPGAPVMDATSDILEVLVALGGSQQREVEIGARVQVTLPGNTAVTGSVDRIGTIARPAGSQNGGAEPAGATIAASIRLDDADLVRGLDQAPVRAEIATHGVTDVLSVPVTAIVGRSGGGYAVEVVRDGGERELATVELGLFDATEGRVQVEGDVREGDHVVVPSS